MWKRLWQRFHFCFLQLQIKYRELFKGKRRKETEVFQGPKTRVNLGMEGRALLGTGHFFFLCRDACNYHYIIMLYLEIGISFHHVGVWKKGNKTRKIRGTYGKWRVNKQRQLYYKKDTLLVVMTKWKSLRDFKKIMYDKR